MQPLLLIGLVSVCTMIGHGLSITMERRKKLLADILRALNILKIELSSLLNPLEQALVQTDLPLFSSICDELPRSFSVSDAWQKIKESESLRGRSLDCLTHHDLSVLDRLFEQLGRSGIKSQQEIIQNSILLLEESLADAKERASQIGKLYTSLGFLAGLSLIILFI